MSILPPGLTPAPHPYPDVITGTYYDMPVIALQIRDVKASSRESIVGGIWLSILNCTGFSGSDGYINRPESTPDSTDLNWAVVQCPPWPQDNRLLFIVQCKRACHENNNEVWTTGAEQLGDHLFNAVGQRRGADRTPAYGALAVGRYVKFFRYDYDGATVTDGYPHPGGEAYHLARDCLLVQNALDEIHNNH